MLLLDVFYYRRQLLITEKHAYSLKHVLKRLFEMCVLARKYFKIM